MTRRWKPGLATRVVAALAVFSSLAAAPAEEPKSAVTAAGHLLDLWNEQQLSYRGLPGLAVAVIHDQEVVWSNTYGWADVESRRPMTTSTPFRIGSVTKLFTATAVMQLRDAGKLRLDDPVSEHLPWFSIGAGSDQPPITVRQFLTHTAGLTREAPFPYWTDHVFPDRDELIAALADLDPVHSPASEYKYSNLGMALAGEIVAALSGRSWEEYVEETIFSPLEMTDSDTAPGPEVQAQLATGYMRRRADGSRGVFDYYETGALAPAANIVSTLDDLVRFAKLQLRDEAQADEDGGGATVLAGSTLREMHRVHWLSSWSGGRGLGFGVWERDGKTMVSHGGWIAGNRTHLLLVPEEDIAVVTLANADDGQPHVFGLEAYDLMSGALAEEAGDAGDGSDAGWEAYYGRYSDPWEWEYRVFESNGDLVLYDYSYPPADSANAGVTVLEPVDEAEHTFLMPDGEPLVFEFGEDGEVERIKRRFDYLHRLDESATQGERP